MTQTVNTFFSKSTIYSTVKEEYKEMKDGRFRIVVSYSFLFAFFGGRGQRAKKDDEH